jgi:hypothetical protein
MPKKDEETSLFTRFYQKDELRESTLLVKAKSTEERDYWVTRLSRLGSRRDNLPNSSPGSGRKDAQTPRMTDRM